MHALRRDNANAVVRGRFHEAIYQKHTRPTEFMLKAADRVRSL
jgi:hypothetical protein